MTDYTKYDSPNPFFQHKDISNTCDVDIHMHDHYEIFQALSDNILYYVEGHAYKLAKGDIVITSNKEIHRPTLYNEGPYARRFIQFQSTLIHSFIGIDYSPLQIFDNRQLGHHNHIPIPSHAISVIDDYFDTIESAFILNTPKSLYEGRLILVQFLMELDSLFVSHVSGKASFQSIDPRVYEIRQYLDQHYTDAFSLDALSQNHHIDKYYLSHLFKEHTGFTLLEYVQSKRMMLAKDLLSGDQNITEISQACGYEDYTNFYKTFKKFLKMSPKAYRMTYRQHNFT